MKLSIFIGISFTLPDYILYPMKNRISTLSEEDNLNGFVLRKHLHARSCIYFTPICGDVT